MFQSGRHHWDHNAKSSLLLQNVLPSLDFYCIYLILKARRVWKANKIWWAGHKAYLTNSYPILFCRCNVCNFKCISVMEILSGKRKRRPNGIPRYEIALWRVCNYGEPILTQWLFLCCSQFWNYVWEKPTSLKVTQVMSRFEVSYNDDGCYGLLCYQSQEKLMQST